MRAVKPIIRQNRASVGRITAVAEYLALWRGRLAFRWFAVRYKNRRSSRHLWGFAYMYK